MTRFAAICADAQGRSVQLQLRAEDQATLDEQLRRQGLLPLELTRLGEHAGESRRSRQSALSDTEIEPLIDAVRSGAAAGVPIDVVLRALVDGLPTDNRLGRVATELCERVQSGDSLAEALEHSGIEWPLGLTEVVRAGERSGTLAEGLVGYLERLRWRREAVRRLTSALMYPLLVGGAVLVLLGVLVFVVLPGLADVLSRTQTPGGEVSSVVAVATAVDRYGPFLGVAFALGVVTLVWRLRSGVSWRRLGILLNRVSKLRPLLRSYYRARLCGSISMTLVAGLTLDEAVRLASRSVAGSAVAGSVSGFQDGLLHGDAPSAAAERSELFEPLDIGALRVAERSGELAPVFADIARRANELCQREVDRFARLVEPALTVLLAVLVGGLGMLVVSTLYSTIGDLAR